MTGHKATTWIAVLALFAGMGAISGCSKKKEGADKKQAAKQTPQPAADQSNANQAAGQTGDATGTAKAGDQAAAEKPSGNQAGDQTGDQAGDQAGEQAQADEKIPAGAAEAQVIIVSWKGAMDGVKRTKEQAKALADKVVAQAAKTPFAKLVSQYSDGPNKDSGGKVPPMTKKDASAVFQPVFSLKPGQVSKVVEGPNGYYIFKRIK